MRNSTGSDAERVVVELLQSLQNLGAPYGVAAVNCGFVHNEVQHRLDAVVWTPTGCVVIEVVTLPSQHGGTLQIPLNGPWQLSGQPLSLEDPEGRTPLDRSRDHTFALQSWLADRGLGQRAVHGVMLIVPPYGSHLQIEQRWHDPSFDVIAGDDSERLRHSFEVMARKESHRWTANDVAVAFRGLGILAYLPPPQDLLDEGFLGPIDVTLWHGGPAQAAAEQYAEEMARAAQEDATGLAALRSPWYSPWRLYPREYGDVDLGRAFMRTTLAIGMFVAAAWLIWFVISAFLTYGPG
ncbi:nuclease-related domain-containing protein [Nocardia paucivorans]|uniref:nuclease-related domain-containing protein n=1 Tax=Nocardia paucivorans TaxID=114259 RepID=UPI001FE0D14B|nr:nuclease-related domain-containing protein [Nocardia paucivorans]